MRLAIDYGERYLGLAIETVAGPMPLDPLDLREGNWNKVLLGVVRSHDVKSIIIGLSSGNVELERKTLAFKKSVENLTRLPVELVDESMTSQWAEKKMTEQKVTKRNIKEKSHSLAAYKLLAGYEELQKKIDPGGKIL